MTAYYNEIEPFAAQWLRNLIVAGHIAPGDVDERSISDVTPADLRGYTQCHFFAGIGVWSRALRLAQWPDARPVWTGSCPCQPFSVAGASAGVRDERHLWPHWHWLIEQCRPAVVFGEQVEAAIGHGWLDLVHADMEGIGYAFGHAGLPAAGVGAPHIRQRLWFVAQRLADTQRPGLQVRADRNLCGTVGHDEGRLAVESGHGGVRGVGHPDGAGQQAWVGEPSRVEPRPEQPAHPGELLRPRPTNGHWADPDWIFCRDNKWRPVEPGTSPLAHGVVGRVGRLRAYGNAIVAQAAAEVIGAFMDTQA